jgi:pyruvate/2-oxoglutarate dehydrogenase complex dihydrolipoamide acyltransferase (E2) component
MEEATIGCWRVSVGDTIVLDQPIAELITDKVAYEYPSPGAGTVLALLPAEKSVLPVGSTLAVIGEPGACVDNLAALVAENRRLQSAREAALADIARATETMSAPAAAPVNAQAVRATPAARRLARERGIELATVRGSGPNGMITVEDLAN